ncbi:hypothetical protein M514_05822 [Trichuris suis]|uniref:Uncharacterized protein n=1 Tax=Trichuris suis TaxID=68888 RepID=A0A085NAE0_9BILA|nr:hypothetical protein M514_05822 [Trichuris suis]
MAHDHFCSLFFQEPFVAMWGTMVSFMLDKEYGEKPIDTKAFYLADISQKFNLLKKTLQGSNPRSSKSTVIRTFQYPNLEAIGGTEKDEDLLLYVNCLKQESLVISSINLWKVCAAFLKLSATRVCSNGPNDMATAILGCPSDGLVLADTPEWDQLFKRPFYQLTWH